MEKDVFDIPPKSYAAFQDDLMEKDPIATVLENDYAFEEDSSQGGNDREQDSVLLNEDDFIHLQLSDEANVNFEDNECSPQRSPKHEKRAPVLIQFASKQTLSSKRTNYFCKQCKLSFSKPDMWKIHWRKNHTREEGNTCNVCEWAFYSIKELRKHQKLIHMCQECGNIFCSRASLTVHMENDHSRSKKTTSSKRKIHFCKECKLSFSQQGMWKMHWKKNHVRNEGGICNICGLAFSANKMLLKHQSVIHMCQECGKILCSKRSLKMHYENEHLCCNQCGKAFSNRRMRRRHKEASYICEECNSTFCKKSGLKEHNKKIHNIVDYTCLDCGLALCNASALKKHVKAIHDKIKDYVCRDCGKGFSQRGNLKYHVEKHHNHVLEK